MTTDETPRATDLPQFRMWVVEMPFKKNGFPVVGTFGARSANVVIMTAATWKKLCEAVPQLQTTQFEVGTYGD